MTVDNVSLLEALTGRLRSGMLKVQRFCTRYDPTFTYIQRLTPACQLPGHKGTVTSVDFHPKEPVSEWAKPNRHLSFVDSWFVSPHWWKGRYHACWRNRTGHLCLNDVPYLGHVSGWIDALNLLARIVWYTANARLCEKNSANHKLRNSGKIETRNDLSRLFHVPNVPTPTDRVSVLVRASDLGPVR